MGPTWPSTGLAKIELVGADGIQTVDTTPMRGSQLEQSHPEQVAEHNVTLFERVLTAMATSKPGNDPLAALSTGARNAAPGADIYLIGSGLSTVNPLDLRVIGWGVDPVRLASDPSRRGLLPNLSSHKVTFLGLADTRAPQTNLTNPARTELDAIWTAICHAAHAASCTILPGDLPDIPSATSTPTPLVPVPGDPSIAFTAPTAEKPVQQMTFTDGTAVIRFQPDSATLTDPTAAAHALTAAAAWLKDNPTHKVAITGTTSSEPPHAWPSNQVPSLARARTVRDILIGRLGVAATQITEVIGAGYTATPPDGRPNHLDAARAELNRAVTLLFTLG